MRDAAGVAAVRIGEPELDPMPLPPWRGAQPGQLPPVRRPLRAAHIKVAPGQHPVATGRDVDRHQADAPARGDRFAVAFPRKEVHDPWIGFRGSGAAVLAELALHQSQQLRTVR
jgi:hypothetical protein